MAVELVEVVGREAAGLAAVVVLDIQGLDLLSDSVEVTGGQLHLLRHVQQLDGGVRKRLAQGGQRLEADLVAGL